MDWLFDLDWLGLRQIILILTLCGVCTILMRSIGDLGANSVVVLFPGMVLFAIASNAAFRHYQLLAFASKDFLFDDTAATISGILVAILPLTLLLRLLDDNI